MLFVTSNEGKFEEARSILDVELQRKGLEIEEMQAVEIEKVVRHKVNEAYERVEEPVIVEDTGLFIEDWNGLPGALTKFFLEKLGNEKICQILDEERKSSAETCVAYKDKENTKIFKGVVKGKIAEEPKGEGFGWDPIFVPKGHERTFGEMTTEEKNRLSMRNKALSKVRAYLSDD